MIQFKTFKENKEFVMWQLEQNPHIHNVSPIIFGGTVDHIQGLPYMHAGNFTGPGPATNPMEMVYEHGVSVVFSPNKSLEKLNVISMVQAMQQAFDGLAKGDDVVNPMNRMKLVLDNYRKQHNLDEIGREPEDQNPRTDKKLPK